VLSVFLPPRKEKERETERVNLGPVAPNPNYRE